VYIFRKLLISPRLVGCLENKDERIVNYPVCKGYLTLADLLARGMRASLGEVGASLGEGSKFRWGVGASLGSGRSLGSGSKLIRGGSRLRDGRREQV
jgi:hypothetical protein